MAAAAMVVERLQRGAEVAAVAAVEAAAQHMQR
jgi:hypothetical protein